MTKLVLRRIEGVEHLRKEERERVREREGLRGSDDNNDILCEKNIQ